MSEHLYCKKTMNDYIKNGRSRKYSFISTLILVLISIFIVWIALLVIIIAIHFFIGILNEFLSSIIDGYDPSLSIFHGFEQLKNDMLLYTTSITIIVIFSLIFYGFFVLITTQIRKNNYVNHCSDIVFEFMTTNPLPL